FATHFSAAFDVLYGLKKVVKEEGFSLLKTFPEKMTAKAFFFTLTELGKDPTKSISMKVLEGYQALGEYCDQLYLWVNQTLDGTYAGCDDESEKEPFQQLPAHLQSVMVDQVQYYIDHPNKKSKRYAQIIQGLTAYKQELTGE